MNISTVLCRPSIDPSMSAGRPRLERARSALIKQFPDMTRSEWFVLVLVALGLLTYTCYVTVSSIQRHLDAVASPITSVSIRNTELDNSFPRFGLLLFPNLRGNTIGSGCIHPTSWSSGRSPFDKEVTICENILGPSPDYDHEPPWFHIILLPFAPRPLPEWYISGYMKWNDTNPECNNGGLSVLPFYDHGFTSCPTFEQLGFKPRRSPRASMFPNHRYSVTIQAIETITVNMTTSYTMTAMAEEDDEEIDNMIKIDIRGVSEIDYDVMVRTELVRFTQSDVLNAIQSVIAAAATVFGVIFPVIVMAPSKRSFALRSFVVGLASCCCSCSCCEPCRCCQSKNEADGVDNDDDLLSVGRWNPLQAQS
jgi:hypothetical protein